MVFFTDKQNSPYSVSNPSAFLSPRAIARRQRQQIAVTEADLPPNPAYVQGVAATGSVRVREYSRWLNAVLVQATTTDVQALQLLPYVQQVEYVAPAGVGGRIAGSKAVLQDEAQPPSDTLQQFDMLDIAAMRAAGYQGDGMLVAVLDGGFEGMPAIPAFDSLFSRQGVVLAYDFIGRDTAVYRYSDHGTRVVSLLVAQNANPIFAGVVPQAGLLLFVTEDVRYEYRLEEYRWLVAAEKADSAGADVLLSSLGYNTFDDPAMDYTPQQLDGSTAVVSRAAQLAAERGMLVVVSAGNTGNTAWGKVLFPADARDCLAIGSVNATLLPSAFSAEGPTADGRIKPDLMALGSGTYVINKNGTIVGASGTSFAAPLVAGLATGLWQAFPDKTASELLAALRMSASQAEAPDNSMGYGIPSYLRVHNYLEATTATDWYAAYPNPVADNYLTVKIYDAGNNKDVSIRLFDAQGKQIADDVIGISWRQNEALLELGGLYPGIYIVNLRSQQHFSRFKIVKL